MSRSSRSAAQRYARLLKRRNRPTFAFTHLPAELQLLVRLTIPLTAVTKILCKCDPVSIRRLLRISPYVRELFLCFPETATRDILAELPPAISRLLRVSWALQNMSIDELDLEITEAMLHSKSLLDWPVASSRILINEDPLAAIESLIDLFIEVDMAVHPVAQGMSAALNASTIPNVVVPPIFISTTEHTRIACSLLVIQIYYTLCLKLSSDWAELFPANFIRCLQPWQIAQAISVESFLQACTQLYGFSAYMLIDQRYICRECMSQKYAYIRRYIEVIERPIQSPDIFFHISFSHFAVSAMRQNHVQEETDAGHSSNAMSLDTQLRNRGWVMYNALVSPTQPLFSSSDCCRQALLHLGVLFWDDSRLMAWDLTDRSSIINLAGSVEAEQRRVTDRNNKNWQLSYLRDPVSVAKAKASQIVQWTRCPVQCSLEEWLYQKMALLRLAGGRPPVPSKYLEPGMLCYRCGLDGHEGHYCDESAWSDDGNGP